MKNLPLLRVLGKVLWFYHNSMLVMYGDMDIKDFFSEFIQSLKMNIRIDALLQ